MMGCFTPATAILGAGAINAGASIFGGANAASASTQAAQIQADTARQVAAMQQGNFNRGFDFLTGQIASGQSNLRNFQDIGGNALDQLVSLTGAGPGGNPLTAPLTSPLDFTFKPDLATLAQTPGYQFSLQQGQQAVQNQFASQGLGASGAALKGAANFAEGLAGTTFQNQFQNYQTQLLNTQANRQQIYNQLGGIGGLALPAATTSANLGIGAGTNALNSGINSGNIVGNTLTSGAAAQAGGVVGSANAINAGISGVTGAASNTGLLLALNNAGLFGRQDTGSDFIGA